MFSFVASMQGRNDILGILILKGANVCIGNNRNTTPIHKAVQAGEMKCMKTLMKAGADINVQVNEIY